MEQTTDILHFERRTGHRRPLSGQATALREVSPNSGAIRKICTFQLHDMSDGGMGVSSTEPVTPGTGVTIFVQAHGPEGGFNADGRVVRCVPCKSGYWLGISFAARAAA